MLTQVPGPKILSDACHEFSARIDLCAFDPLRTPREFGVELPPELSSAVPKRLAEFVAGRFAAMQALKAAGCTDHSALAIGPDRSPQWPTGYIGSITHTGCYVSAVAAVTTRIRAVGRDTEMPLDEQTALEIQERTLRPEEILLLPNMMTSSTLSLAQVTGLIFSAKESLFKALGPLAGNYFDFLDARVIGIADGRIHLRLETDLGNGFSTGFEIEGRFELGDRIHTAVELSATGI